MVSKLVPSLVVLSALCGSYAAPSNDNSGVANALSRIGLDTSDVIAAATLGSDSSGHTSYSVLFAIPTTTNPSGTAPDTTITQAATLVVGSADAHLDELSGGVTINEDCAIGNSSAVCTVVYKNSGGSVIQSVVVTNTLSAPAATATGTLKNGAGRLGVAGASLVSIVGAGVVLARAIV
ncbi:hypothetical protein GSI_11797 [Ganoderma sinense ZZ0214-1]|uniref:Uncharacterized protein n=1 Tax=Ganoderma sinense ZZ0214-1 TaxID=1077348 RepID=A0A2G8RX01_9APHY|nr:hypothetical protein GSI_11797 [Ganoderma sinense ZZ0214-1]